MGEEEQKDNKIEVVKVVDSSERLGWKMLNRIAVTFFLTFVCCILFFFLLLRFQGFTSVWRKLVSASQSIIIGLVLAYLLNPIMKYFERRLDKLLAPHMQNRDYKKTSKAIAIGLTTAFLILSIVLMGVLILPSVWRSIMRLINMMPRYEQTIVNFIENGQFGDSQFSLLIQDWIRQGADYLQKWFKETVLSQTQNYITQITSGVYSVIKGLMNFIVGIIVMDYVMAIQGTLVGQIKKALYATMKPKYANTFLTVMRKTNSIFGGFITGKIIDSAIIGCISYVCLSMLKIPDVVLVAVIIGVTNIIPFFGPFIGAVPSLLLVWVQSPWHALYLLIFIIVLQQVDGNIIGPKILGNSTGLSSFWIMVAILIGGGMFGVLGMILGVPLFAVAYYIVQQIIQRELLKKKLPTGTEVYEKLDHIDEKNTLIPLAEGKRKKQGK